MDIGQARLQPVHPAIIQRGNFPVFLRRQPLKPRLAGMHREPVHAGRQNRIRQRIQRGFRSCSSTPMRHFTVTGIDTAAFMAETQRATRSGSRIRQAPKLRPAPGRRGTPHSG